MWLVVAAVLVAGGVLLTGAGIVGGQRGDERAGAFFAVGVAVFGAGTIALGLYLLSL